MKKLLIIPFLLISLILSATDYYVKTGGSDSNTGLSDAQAWKTITKVNSYWNLGLFNPGDNIYFNRGDTFYGELKARESGTSGSPITIGAYGSGADPIITGFTTLSSWSAPIGSVYHATLAGAATTNMVTVDGVQVGMGQTPDATAMGDWIGYWKYVTATLTPPLPALSGTITGEAADINSAVVNWTGADVAFRFQKWVLQRGTVTGHSGQVLSYAYYHPWPQVRANSGYFILNDLRCVTTTNEWYHNHSTNTFYIYGNPAAKTVKAATINNLFSNDQFDYITLDNISFMGSISDAISLTNASNYITIQNCSVSFAGQDGIYNEGSYSTFDNNVISNVNRTGIFSMGTNDVIITNNILSNIGIIRGQCDNGAKCTGIQVGSDATNCLVQYNNVQNTGYQGIMIEESTNYVTVKNNFVNRAGLTLDDGGGIYAPGVQVALLIDGNIVLNMIGDDNGIATTGPPTMCGIYIDANPNHITVQNNTSANGPNAGLKMNMGAYDNVLTNNTTFNNNRVEMNYMNTATTSLMSNNSVTGNIFFAKAAPVASPSETKAYTIKFEVNGDDYNHFGTSDYNYLARPITAATANTIYAQGVKNLAAWQSFTSQDIHSSVSPVTVADTSLIDFYYNATKSNRVISVTNMIDVRGTKYPSSVTLLPYTSIILMPDPSPGGVVLVTSIAVTGTVGATTITTDNGTLQMITTVLPVNATYPSVIWSKQDGTGQASISSTGLLTAIEDGTVTVTATSIDGSGVYGTRVITMSSQTPWPFIDNYMIKHNGAIIKIGSAAIKHLKSLPGSFYVYVSSGLITYRKGERDGVYNIDYSADGGATWELSLITLALDEEIIIMDIDQGVTDYRHEVRGTSYKIDHALTPTSFAGTEGLDWENIYSM